MLIDDNGPCDLLAGIVAGDCCRLGVDTRLRRELRGLAADNYMTAEEAAAYGLVDKVLEHNKATTDKKD